MGLLARLRVAVVGNGAWTSRFCASLVKLQSESLFSDGMKYAIKGGVPLAIPRLAHAPAGERHAGRSEHRHRQ